MAFFRPYFSDKMQSHKYSCRSLITPKSTENAGRLQKNHRTLAKKNPQNFISVLPSWHRKKKKRTNNFILAYSLLTCKGQSRFSDGTPCRTRAYAKHQHTFLWEQIFCFGEAPVATPNPILSNIHTHTQFTRDLKQKNYKKILKFLC